MRTLLDQDGVLYLMIAKAVLALMVWAGMVGRPDDLAGGNWVWLKDGKPGVYGSPEPRWTCKRRPDVEPRNKKKKHLGIIMARWWRSRYCVLMLVWRFTQCPSVHVCQWWCSL